MHDGLGHVGLAKLEAVLERRQVAGVLLQPVHVLLGPLPKPIQEQPLQMARRNDLRLVSVQPSIPDPDSVDLVHQLGD